MANRWKLHFVDGSAITIPDGVLHEVAGPHVGPTGPLVPVTEIHGAGQRSVWVNPAQVIRIEPVE